MQFFKLFILLNLCLSHLAFAKSALPKLVTKQALLNIRFISNDGKVTYFQNNSGELFLSSKYKNHRLLKLKPRTQYSIHTSLYKKYILITADESHHSQLNINKSNRIFLAKYNEKEVREVASGITPKLHLEDEWYSFFSPRDQQIQFANIKNKAKKHAISLSNKTNPYFRPVVDMANEQILLYSDINSKGFSALLTYNTNSKQFKPILKSKAPGMKIEFCKIGQYFVLGEFSYYDVERGSNIFLIDIVKDQTLSKTQLLYTSSLSDLGQMKCHHKENKIFFIKNLQQDSTINYNIYDVVAIDPNTGNVKIRSDIGKVTQLTQMDDRLLTLYQGDYYILSGQAGLENTNFFSNRDFKVIKTPDDLNELNRLKKKKRRRKRRKGKRRKRRRRKKK